MDQKVRTAIMNQVASEAYAEKLSLTLTELSDGYAVVEMVPDPRHGNMFEMVHGAAIISLMDEAFQASCNSHGRVAVALNMNVTFHKVWDEDGTLIASCQALAYRKNEMLPFLER
ncbi:MAG: PaaI family thioesterase [Deltaproteobacteria bacterium]